MNDKEPKVSDCACHEPHISDKVIHTKERCYLKPLVPPASEMWEEEKRLGEKFDDQHLYAMRGHNDILRNLISSEILAAEKRGEEKGKQTCGFCAEEHERIVAAAKSEGYKEGAKDGEGTKNGVKRYQMGFDAGKAEGGKEMLERAVEACDKAKLGMFGMDNEQIGAWRVRESARERKKEEINKLLSLSPENKPK